MQVQLNSSPMWLIVLIVVPAEAGQPPFAAEFTQNANYKSMDKQDERDGTRVPTTTGTSSWFRAWNETHRVKKELSPQMELPAS